MKFELDSEDHHFIFKLEMDPNYMPDGQFDIFDPEDIEAQLGGHLSFYQVTIVSNPIGKAETLTHYMAGLMLPKDPEELVDELEALIDNNKYLEHILSHWDLEKKEAPIYSS